MDDGRQSFLARNFWSVMVVVLAIALNAAVLYNPPLLECRPFHSPANSAGVYSEFWTCEPVGRSHPFVQQVWLDKRDEKITLETTVSFDQSRPHREYVMRYSIKDVGTVYYAKDLSRLYAEIAIIWAVAGTLLAIMSLWRR